MFDTLQEHNDFYYSSESEADRAEAMAIGYYHQDRAWISTDRDVWHANPYYTGPLKPHPEDDEAFIEWEKDPIAWSEAEKVRRANRLSTAINDEIPF